MGFTRSAQLLRSAQIRERQLAVEGQTLAPTPTEIARKQSLPADIRGSTPGEVEARQSLSLDIRGDIPKADKPRFFTFTKKEEPSFEKKEITTEAEILRQQPLSGTDLFIESVAAKIPGGERFIGFFADRSALEITETGFEKGATFFTEQVVSRVPTLEDPSRLPGFLKRELTKKETVTTISDFSKFLAFGKFFPSTFNIRKSLVGSEVDILVLGKSQVGSKKIIKTDIIFKTSRGQKGIGTSFSISKPSKVLGDKLFISRTDFLGAEIKRVVKFPSAKFEFFPVKRFAGRQISLGGRLGEKIIISKGRGQTGILKRFGKGKIADFKSVSVSFETSKGSFGVSQVVGKGFTSRTLGIIGKGGKFKPKIRKIDILGGVGRPGVVTKIPKQLSQQALIQTQNILGAALKPPVNILSSSLVPPLVLKTAQTIIPPKQKIAFKPQVKDQTLISSPRVIPRQVQKDVSKLGDFSVFGQRDLQMQMPKLAVRTTQRQRAKQVQDDLLGQPQKQEQIPKQTQLLRLRQDPILKKPTKQVQARPFSFGFVFPKTRGFLAFPFVLPKLESGFGGDLLAGKRKFRRTPSLADVTRFELGFKVPKRSKALAGTGLVGGGIGVKLPKIELGSLFGGVNILGKKKKRKRRK